MMKGAFPTEGVLARFPALEGLYSPFISNIKQGNVVGFDQALVDLEARLVQLNIWLMIVKVREIAVSRVFKKWYVRCFSLGVNMPNLFYLNSAGLLWGSPREYQCLPSTPP
jgi:hypothetical protein